MKQLLIALIATAFGLYIEHTFLREDRDRSTVSRVFKGWQSDRRAGDARGHGRDGFLRSDDSGRRGDRRP